MYAEQGKTSDAVNTCRLNRNFDFQIIRTVSRSYKIPLFLQHIPAKGISVFDNFIKC